MGVRPRLLLATALALLAAALGAQSALAATPTPMPTQPTATVRVESSAYTIAPPTKAWPYAVFYDSAGNPYHPGHASALGALAAAAKTRGFTWEASYGGNFVTQIGGFTSLADFSQGWVYAVNGVGFPVVDVGALDFQLQSGDRVLFAQYPDGTYAHGTKALVVRFGQDSPAYTTGDTVSVDVVGDDLAKVNSTAEATRHGVDASAIETPAQFAGVDGAWVHVGSDLIHADVTGHVSLAGLAPGTYRVWADREMDPSFAYIRSLPRMINIADALALTDLKANPDPFTPGHAVRFTFTLSRAATVKYTVRTKSGTLIASLSRRLAAGPVAMRWSGENAAGRPVRPGQYRVRVTATDTWGRMASPLTTLITAS